MEELKQIKQIYQMLFRRFLMFARKLFCLYFVEAGNGHVFFSNCDMNGHVSLLFNNGHAWIVTVISRDKFCGYDEINANVCSYFYSNGFTNIQVFHLQ